MDDAVIPIPRKTELIVDCVALRNFLASLSPAERKDKFRFINPATLNLMCGGKNKNSFHSTKSSILKALELRTDPRVTKTFGLTVDECRSILLNGDGKPTANQIEKVKARAAKQAKAPIESGSTSSPTPDADKVRSGAVTAMPITFRAARADLADARKRIVGFLMKSPVVTDEFVDQLSLGAADASLGDKADAVAGALLGLEGAEPLTPKQAIRTAKLVRLDLDERLGPDDDIHGILKNICGRILRLIYTEVEIEDLRRAFANGESVFVNIPAANEIFAEIVMARLDRRGLRLQPYRDDGRRRGVNLVPTPATTDPNLFDMFAKDFRLGVLGILLLPDEHGLSDDEKDKRCRRRLENRFEREKGRLYFLSKISLNPDESADFEAMVGRVAKAWKGIRFARLKRDPDLAEGHDDLLDEVLDMLPEVEK